MKLLLAMITTMLLAFPACSDTEPLKGGVDYIERIPALQDEQGVEQHGERTIEWNSWIDLFEHRAIQLMNRRQHYWGENVYAIYIITIYDNGAMSVHLKETNNYSYAIAMEPCYEQLQYTKYVRFPKGTQRTEITLDNVWIKAQSANVPINYDQYHAAGFNEQQTY